MKMMSYIIKDDYGFAPNPYGGFLTLATCKPAIRSSAGVGDILVATGSSTGDYENRLIYAAKVSRVIDMNEYFETPCIKLRNQVTRIKMGIISIMKKMEFGFSCTIISITRMIWIMIWNPQMS